MLQASNSIDVRMRGARGHEFAACAPVAAINEVRVGGTASATQCEHSRLLRTALELRFQVYCIECNFLSSDNYPAGIESDEYDEFSAHFYAFDPDDELVGYVRLVRPGPDQRFPFQSHCEVSANGRVLPAPHQAAEISRLIVRKDYRRRRGDQLSGVTAEQNVAAFAGDRRHHSSQVLLNLYRQMYQYSLANGIRFWYAAMERPLARSLSRLSFTFEAIGPTTDYFGPVAPYMADPCQLVAQASKRDPALGAWFNAPGHHSVRAL